MRFTPTVNQSNMWVITTLESTPLTTMDTGENTLDWEGSGYPGSELDGLPTGRVYGLITQ